MAEKFSWEKEPNKKTESVGKAVYDILSKPQEDVQVQDVINNYAKEYTEQVNECVQSNWKKFHRDFHVLVLHKKEPWAMNVMRNYFIARKTCPTVKTMWNDYKHFMHTVYKVDKLTEKVELLRSLPSPEEAKNILKNWMIYDKQLVDWCKDAFAEMGKDEVEAV